MTDPGTDPAHEARQQVRNAVYRMTGGPGDPRSAVHDPLAALRALVSLRAAVTQAERDAARRAREDRKSWGDIGEALGFDGRAGAAFLYVASDFGRGPVFSWTCPSCQVLVADAGPELGPYDAEDGHGEGCERFAATLAAWDARWEDRSDEGSRENG
jgi:hypothetical protein